MHRLASAGRQWNRNLRHHLPHCIFNRYIPLRQSYSTFFAQNETDFNRSKTDQKDPQITSKAIPELFAANNFLDPAASYPQVEVTDPKVLKSIFDATFEPFSGWDEFGPKYQEIPLQIGTFVEFIHENEVHFGVILREPYARFNPYHNRMIVLTFHNELVKVHPSDVTFVSHEVLDASWTQNLGILANRFDEQFGPRVHLVQILHQFAAEVENWGKPVENTLRIMYPSISDSATKSVSLAEIAEVVAAPSSLASYFHQCALLKAIYLKMCQDPSRWMVPGCLPWDRNSNLANYGCSNTIAPLPLMFSTSTQIHNDVSEFMGFSEKQMAQLNATMKELLDHPKNYDDLVLHFTVWEGKSVRAALNAMLYAIVYPHPQITGKLTKHLTVLEPQQSAQDAIVTLLRNIGIYDNPQNASTDPVLSSGILGSIQNSLVAAAPRDVAVLKTYTSGEIEAEKLQFEDRFSHLRKNRAYYSDHVAYVLPGRDNLAISLEEVNSRQYLVNVHVSDVAAHLSPSTATFTNWTRSSALSIQHLQTKMPFLPTEALENMLFQSTSTSSFVSVGDMAKSTDSVSTCMTLTFKYNPSAEDPLEDLGSCTQISFDELKSAQIKKLDQDTLERSLTGKLEPSILGKFKLFQHKTPSEPESLTATDHHDVNFVYNVMRRHFQARNRNYAVSVRPQETPPAVVKNLSIDGENIRTTLEIQPQKYEKVSFFQTELETFAAALVSAYCSKHKIPVFRRSQQLLAQNGNSDDSVLIRHNNMLLPDFSAGSYFQAAFARDVSGHVSPAAYLYACNHLEPEMCQVSLEEMGAKSHQKLGLAGVVRCTGAERSLEAYLNQMQVLAHVHFAQTGKFGAVQRAARFSRLKALGYPVHGPLAAVQMEHHGARMWSAQLGAQYWEARVRRFWALSLLQQKPQLCRHMPCVITKVCRDIEMSSEEKGSELVRAYCSGLGLEVTMATDIESATIGTEKFIEELVSVDPIRGHVVVA